jgi:diaminopimelate decarboxylase
VKANGNHGILQNLKRYGVELLVTVSGNEILAGLKAGFQPENIILNGNGKQE